MRNKYKFLIILKRAAKVAEFLNNNNYSLHHKHMSINLIRSPRKTDFNRLNTPNNVGPGLYETTPKIGDDREK